MNVQINLGPAEVEDFYDEVSIQLDGMDRETAREVLERLRGMPGIPDLEIEREVAKLPPVDPAFPRRIDVA